MLLFFGLVSTDEKLRSTAWTLSYYDSSISIWSLNTNYGFIKMAFIFWMRLFLYLSLFSEENFFFKLKICLVNTNTTAINDFYKSESLLNLGIGKSSSRLLD